MDLCSNQLAVLIAYLSEGGEAIAQIEAKLVHNFLLHLHNADLANNSIQFICFFPKSVALSFDI